MRPEASEISGALTVPKATPAANLGVWATHELAPPSTTHRATQNSRKSKQKRAGLRCRFSDTRQGKWPAAIQQARRGHFPLVAGQACGNRSAMTSAKVTPAELRAMKTRGEKIAALTAY